MEKADHDIALFERIKDDDRLALNTLFSTYYQRLCVFANSFLRRPEEAEEIVSDVFITLWKNRRHLTISKNVKAYLYVSVRHAALAVIKKRNQPPYMVEDEAMFELPDDALPERALEYYELAAHIDKIVDKLPPRCRQIFMMNRFDGFRYKEISEILEISEKTVENQLIKALSIVRASVTQYQNDADLPEVVTLT